MLALLIRSALLALLVPLLLATGAQSSITFSPRSAHSAPRSLTSDGGALVINLDATHTLTPVTSKNRFGLLQRTQAMSNMTGCGSIDFSAVVIINGQGPFRLIMDSGSTTLAVVSSTCSNCDNATPTYTPPAGTLVSGGGTVYSTYGSGANWTGHAYTASVSVGDSQTAAMTIATIENNNGFINGEHVCAVNSNARTFLNTSQGIMGLAYPAIAVPGTDSWITNYINQWDISAEFTIQMCPTSGNIWIGSYDASFLTGQFTYIPIVAQNWYSVIIMSISVLTQSSGGITSATTRLAALQSDFGACVTGSDCPIVDSGTTQILLPSTPYSQLVNAIESDTYYQLIFGAASRVDPLTSGYCQYASAALMPSLATLQARLPKVSFTFASDTSGSNPVTITINSIPGYLSLNYDDSGNAYYCRGITSLNGAHPSTILGIGFMGQFTVRHDLANSRLGFANTARCGEAAPPLPNYQWSTGNWGACSATCGYGVQWRQVNCTDIYGGNNADIACANQYSGNKPAESQQTCATTACATNTALPTFTAVTSSATSMTQGSTYTISYTYSASTAPDSVVLMLQPVTANAGSLPSYITRNASAGISGSGSYQWKVPFTVAAGQYYLSAYGRGYFGSNVYQATSTVTIAVCSGACSDPCAAGPVACSNRGTCDSRSGALSCTCVAGYTGATCNTAPTNGCAIQCVNGGTAVLPSCTCACPSSFTGVLCERRYANLTATVGFDPSVVLTASNKQIFSRDVQTDLAYAVGAAPSAVTIQSVNADSSNAYTVVAFSLQTQSNTATITAWINSLDSQFHYQNSSQLVTLTGGFVSGSIVSFATLSIPPPDDDNNPDGSAGDSWIKKYFWVIIIAVVGAVVLALLLYCLGRCCGAKSTARTGPGTQVVVQQSLHGTRGSVHAARNNYGY